MYSIHALFELYFVQLDNTVNIFTFGRSFFTLISYFTDVHRNLSWCKCVVLVLKEEAYEKGWRLYQ